jgi:hypothetical protein
MMEGVNSSMIYLIYFKNLCKCQYVIPPITQLKKKEGKENNGCLEIMVNAKV